MANEKKHGNFEVVNHLDFLLEEKIVEYKSKEISGNGAGSQEIDYCKIADFAYRTFSNDSNRRILLDDETISEIQKLISYNINALECDEYKTNNFKIHVRSAIAFLVLDKARAIVKSNKRPVSYRWFVKTFNIKHRDTLTKYIDIVQTQQWSALALEQLNQLQNDIIKLIFF